MKTKYKLLFVITLPFIILIAFVTKQILDSYRELRDMQRGVEMASIADDIGQLIDALEREQTFSLFQFAQKKSSLSKDLIHVRNETDVEVEDFKSALAAIKEQERNVINFQSTLDKINQLIQKRSLIDSSVITMSEIENNYSHIITALLNDLTKMTHHLTNINLRRNLFAQIALLQERRESDDETRIVLLALFLQGKLSLANYQAFSLSIGRQEAFQQTFFQFAPIEQETAYKNMMKDSALNSIARTREMILENGPEVPLNIDTNKWLEDQSKKSFFLQEIQNKLTERGVQEGEEFAKEIRNNILLLLSFLILMIIGTFYFTLMGLRSLVKKLQDEVGGLATSSQEILAAITQASSSTAETASAITETTTTIEELKQTAKLSADKAKNVSKVASHAIEVLNETEQSVNDTIEGMNLIQSGMETISQSIVRLSEHSRIIGDIVGTVNDLAEQSHLLAVNAAIEAAKAGEQGKGFTVVAQEVRSLAEQSKQATVQIKKILQDIQNATDAAVMATERGSKSVQQGVIQSTQTNESIRNLAEEVSKVSEEADQISLSSDQQHVAVEQITIAMSNIKEASRLLVEQMRQIEEGIKGLNHVGSSLKDLSQEYQI